MGFVQSGIVTSCRKSQARRVCVKVAAAAAGEGWDLLDFDPSHVDKVAIRAKRVRTNFRTMPDSVSGRDGSGAWRGTNYDESRDMDVMDMWSQVDFDETHVNGCIMVEKPVGAPKQCARPYVPGKGIWASAAVDPSKMSSRVSGWDKLDMDPSRAGEMFMTSGRITCSQRQQPESSRNRAMSGLWKSVDVDESCSRGPPDMWINCGEDPSSAGDVSLLRGRKVTHAVMQASMMDESGEMFDMDPSHVTPVDRKAEDEATWANTDWDETHDDERVIRHQHSEVMVPMRLLWLLEDSNRVFLETVAGGSFVIIARSGAHVGAAFVRETDDLTAVRAEIPHNMELHEVPSDLYNVLHELANRDLEMQMTKWEGTEKIMVGAGI
mmetsp:Transcript_9807/g.29877  ORF Transcript_9807/g.29877 Transcript_9807/m.29877 type:complete len:380 (+) Transcript_9807:97-1236(+)|eukprot:CAMPEP_0198727536 /NCGR_PEP_ID=MMETSP1475-20131203/4408_1 /TAXON_ID= ORGANISM="Unidentified sp., Strain CCMP1999" /NCGR_SAMPLE_ID=MMETSP1475 /ASSEMBLY_ACC=CAM_ASM_001111 /LENGTH=379 /DNA_ID=CAMNT_0044489587 /DNA_START=69 /DNA_END=1208 /DNA_ORIENTATION=+